MTKKEVASLLRKELTEAIQLLPDDANYVNVTRFMDETHEDEESQFDDHGHLYQIELIAEVKGKEGDTKW